MHSRLKPFCAKRMVSTYTKKIEKSAVWPILGYDFSGVF